MFSNFQLSQGLIDAVHRMGFKAPTEIQAKAIPALMGKRDLIGQSKTGSGKTAAYLLPILNQVMNSDDLALILVPTRELALQVDETIRKFLSAQVRVRMATVIGGASMRQQFQFLVKKPNVIIATPGRLMDHLNRNSSLLMRLQFLVLDEADRMLDMGFLPQIKRILTRVPKARQTALFSATFSPEIRKLAKEMMSNPVEAAVHDNHSTPVTINQQTRQTTGDKKNEVILDELYQREGSVLVFVRTKRRSDKLAKHLQASGFKVNRIHGDRSLAQRKTAVQEFKTGSIRVLVATDIASRGLDIAQVGHVINFDLPECPEDYVHRIGRTGRAGHSGHALSFVTPEDQRKWKDITRFTQQAKSRGHQPSR
ncbi:MAG: DEAD/DEAH box helicase [Oligoflexia bacterium]|nr:DEAD/DEAH box helicase [Oligoflexia bacterium]